jgi:predicted secreted protein with PEFG-CTERM motif
MKTKAISSIFVLFAIAAGMASMAPTAFADHSEVTIVAADNSGVPTDCNAGWPDATTSDCYTPSTATVDVGGTVTMLNSDASGMMHTFTSGTGFADELSAVTFDSGNLMADMSYTWIPEVAGEVPYYCQLHPWMIGVIIVQEAAAAGHDDDHAAEEAAEAAEAAEDVELMVMISDSQVMGGTQIELEFNILHVNYELTATQNGEVVFETQQFHSMDLIATHQIDALGSDENPIDVEVVSLGIGAPGEEDSWTGEVGEVTTAKVVPEFGTIAMMVLAVAIISIVAVTAKSRVVPRF